MSHGPLLAADAPCVLTAPTPLRARPMAAVVSAIRRPVLPDFPTEVLPSVCSAGDAEGDEGPSWYGRGERAAVERDGGLSGDVVAVVRQVRRHGSGGESGAGQGEGGLRAAGAGVEGHGDHGAVGVLVGGHLERSGATDGGDAGRAGADEPAVARQRVVALGRRERGAAQPDQGAVVAGGADSPEV